MQSALTAVRNTLVLEHDLPEDQFPQYISSGFPDVTWLVDVGYEGGLLRGDLPAEWLSALNAFKAEMEKYRGTIATVCVYMHICAQVNIHLLSIIVLIKLFN